MLNMGIKAVVDTSELDAMCRVVCFNQDCIHHGRDWSCDKKNIIIDENGCVHAGGARGGNQGVFPERPEAAASDEVHMALRPGRAAGSADTVSRRATSGNDRT